MDNATVRCYSGHEYAQEPRSFMYRGVEYDIAGIEKTWREPGEKYFLARTEENKFFRLCYNEVQERWTVTEVVRR